MFKNKALPYPILDRSDNLRDDYVDGDYQVALKVQEPSEDGRVTFKFMHQCSVKALTDLVVTGQAAYCILVICPDTLSRKAHISFQGLQALEFEMNDFHGKVEFIPQIVAVKPISGFTSEYLNEEYGAETFDLKPGDVLALDKSEARFFEFNRLKFETLISVRRSEDIDPFAYQIDLSTNYIYIDMGTKLRELWDELRLDTSKRPFLAMSIYKDCFLHAMEVLVSSDEATENRWARALSQKLHEMGIELPEGKDLTQLNLIAQKILEQESVRALYQNKGAAQ